jgi:hypothetical protein
MDQHIDPVAAIISDDDLDPEGYDPGSAKQTQEPALQDARRWSVDETSPVQSPPHLGRPSPTPAGQPAYLGIYPGHRH